MGGREGRERKEAEDPYPGDTTGAVPPSGTDQPLVGSMGGRNKQGTNEQKGTDKVVGFWNRGILFRAPSNRTNINNN